MTNTAPCGRSRWRSRSAIVRSMSRCWRIRGTRRTARRPRRRCGRSPTSSTGSCASITKAIFPLPAKSGRPEPPRAAGARNIRARLAKTPDPGRLNDVGRKPRPDAERKLNTGKSRIDFQADPSKYRHWKLNVDGDVATLLMDVDEKGTLFEGYELKLNSYDLGVDIELADAVQRLRFEHPQGRAVVITGGLGKVFCAGANIRMLAQSEHWWKVNFCKFTNETRGAIEDATEGSGQTYLAAVN